MSEHRHDLTDDITVVVERGGPNAMFYRMVIQGKSSKTTRLFAAKVCAWCGEEVSV